MVKYDYQSLCLQIGGMPPWKLYALAASCAEKVAPIVQGIGSIHTCRLVRNCLDLLWSAPLKQPAAGDFLQLVKAVESTPEWDCDGDSDYLPFEVAQDLDRIHLALRAVASAEPRQEIQGLISLMRDLADCWDATLSLVKTLPGVPAPHALEESEVRSQERLIGMLAVARQPSRKLVERVKAEAVSVGALFRQATPLYCYAFVSSKLRLHAAQAGRGRRKTSSS